MLAEGAVVRATQCPNGAEGWLGHPPPRPCPLSLLWDLCPHHPLHCPSPSQDRGDGEPGRSHLSLCCYICGARRVCRLGVPIRFWPLPLSQSSRGPSDRSCVPSPSKALRTAGLGQATGHRVLDRFSGEVPCPGLSASCCISCIPAWPVLSSQEPEY